MTQIYDSMDDEKLNKRLTERRKGVFNSSKKKKPEKSTIYCNVCNIPESLSVCSVCNDNLCPDCFNGKTVCIRCQKNLKKNLKNNKIYPSVQTRPSETIIYIKSSFLKRILCCFKW